MLGGRKVRGKEASKKRKAVNKGQDAKTAFLSTTAGSERLGCHQCHYCQNIGSHQSSVESRSDEPRPEPLRCHLNLEPPEGTETGRTPRHVPCSTRWHEANRRSKEAREKAEAGVAVMAIRALILLGCRAAWPLPPPKPPQEWTQYCTSSFGFERKKPSVDSSNTSLAAGKDAHKKMWQERVGSRSEAQFDGSLLPTEQPRSPRELGM